jgi:hypothetical protein
VCEYFAEFLRKLMPHVLHLTGTHIGVERSHGSLEHLSRPPARRRPQRV